MKTINFKLTLMICSNNVSLLTTNSNSQLTYYVFFQHLPWSYSKNTKIVHLCIDNIVQITAYQSRQKNTQKYRKCLTYRVNF